MGQQLWPAVHPNRSDKDPPRLAFLKHHRDSGMVVVGAFPTVSSGLIRRKAAATIQMPRRWLLILLGRAPPTDQLTIFIIDPLADLNEAVASEHSLCR
jgi:hypothetical protein